MTVQSPAVIIVGTGAAGLSAAIEATRTGARAVLITKRLYTHETFRWASDGGCTWKTNAFNAAVRDGDSVASHIQDTLRGGGMAGNPDLVATLCHGAVALIPWLESLGLAFERDDHAHLATRPFGGNDHPRAVYLDDRLGFYIQRVLVAEVTRLIHSGMLQVWTGLRAQRLLQDDAGHICGVEVLSVDTLELITLKASAVILADGGGASMYQPAATSTDKTCDGLCLGIRAGAEALDLEYVQFHPTGLATPVLTYDGSLIGENMRFQGAVLLNRASHRFMFDYHPKGELATRDEVSRAIYLEILAGRAVAHDAVVLDISACRQLIITEFPALFQRLRHADFDPRSHTHIYVRPTAHFMMGGLKIDRHAACTLPGLYCAGETAGGVHGANRIGGNGLSEAMVFGRIAGQSAAARVLGSDTPPLTELTVSGAYHAVSQGTNAPEALLQTLRRAMYLHAGLVRDKTSLQTMGTLLADLTHAATFLDYGLGSRAAMQVQTALDLENLLLASHLIVAAALNRKESRGSHYRTDYPHQQSPYQGYAVTQNSAGTLAWSGVAYQAAVQEI